jgi:hypothetical protein
MGRRVNVAYPRGGGGGEKCENVIISPRNFCMRFQIPESMWYSDSLSKLLPTTGQNTQIWDKTREIFEKEWRRTRIDIFNIQALTHGNLRTPNEELDLNAIYT